MRNLLALAAFVVLACTGTGLWRGWYHIESLSAEPGRSAFRVEIDRVKIADDVSTAAKRIISALRDKEEKPKEEPAAR